MMNDVLITVAEELFPGRMEYSLDDVSLILNTLSSNINIKESKKGARKFRRFVNLIGVRNRSNLDTMLLITALKGGGKSSTAIQIARQWCSLHGWVFDPKKYIAYTNADLSKKIDTLPPFSPLIADESVRFITSEDWNKKENKTLKKKLAQIREKHFLFMLCFPLKISKVEKTYLESYVNYWIELYARGKGALFVRDSNPVFDSWRLQSFKDIGSYTEFTDPDKIKEKLKQHPCFWKFLTVPKVPDKMYARYKTLRDANVYRDDSDVMKSITKEDIYQALLILALNDIMSNDASITSNRILMHIKNNYDISIPKSDLSKMVGEAGKIVNTMRENSML